MDEIKVTITKRPDRKFYTMRYRDPMSGQIVAKSSKCEYEKAAIAAAGKWEAELREGRYFTDSRIKWDDFRERYEEQVLASLADRTEKKVTTVLNAVDRILKMKGRRLAELNSQRLSHFQAQLRSSKSEGAKRAETTIAGYLAHLQAALTWAVGQGYLAKLPSIPKVQRAKKSGKGTPMKGRPITREEFERMLESAPRVLLAEPKKPPKRMPTEDTLRRRQEMGIRIVASWTHYMEGLWASGLRLSESLELYWDRDDRLCVDLDGKRPMLRIPAELEKGNQDRLLPMAPEFAQFLLKTPEADRVGRVFKLVAKRKVGERLGHYRVSRVISKMGKAAGVVVSKSSGKYASAHDLRRAFGERWAVRVMPQVLMELMRHESIETTLRYYVGRNAQATADALWQAFEASRTDVQVDSSECLTKYSNADSL